MSARRPAIPKAVKEAVLKEFHHLCAICGEKDPQLHHIDEDNANNDPMNLLPLCPNHHLTDQHNPTSKIDPLILRLFRVYKDPTILTPQFVPLYQRLTFLDADPEAGQDPHAYVCACYSAAEELVAFIQALEGGQFYAQKIGKSLRNGHYLLTPFNPESIQKDILRMRNSTRSDVYRMVMELLRYQPWWREKPL
jgi:hypothetical protein